MTNNSDSYSKKEAFREPKSRVRTVKYSLNDSILNASKLVSEHYSKSDGELSSKLFIIVSGGTKRERQYFTLLLNNREEFKRIRVEFISKNGEGLTAIKLYETALFIKEKARDSISGEEDLFFLISDRDHYYPELVDILPKCEVENFSLIVCNPCFEVWLYYGYFCSSPDRNGFTYSDIKKISSEFKTYLNKKVVEVGVGGADPRKAIYLIDEAIKNSKNNYSIDENKICNIYSTNMFLLAEELQPLINDELNRIRKKNVLKSETFKKNNM